ncbi:Serine carboxypeptidases (lysosomal cathepsin A) [Handroanthus impetiginosus]|uniref:Carboxypeptidase n=1 Tax=Handroanthus impetiginosus TaxID=429701 RepID=A0A2G9GLU2_9LAMI|nr:Serine carboxypeptidases (lysosomal cathepsin A) [Handroanthus impetiginosus]
MKASSPTFLSLFLLLLLLLSPLPSVVALLRAPPRLPSVSAEKLIRELNLFPNQPINIVGDSNRLHAAAPRIVERRFKFPNVIDPRGVSVEELGHHAGYYQIEHSHAARMFYFFFESRNSSEDPVVIWLTGGPGCSSEMALFYENGPFTIANNLSLVWNEYGWDKVSNILYVDQPIGTGFSYSSDRRDIRHDEKGVSDDLYDFLQAFFKEHPHLAKNDFYITGESYAGHYIPALAARVHQGNKAKEGIHVNLKGFAIGNGLTDPAIQYGAYADYAMDMGILTQSEHDRINKVLPVCETAIKLCGTDGTISCVAAYIVCNTIFSSIFARAGNVNYYDIRKKCEGSLCYDFSNVEKFLNQKSVRGALGVGDIEFVSCSTTVYEAMLVDWMRNLEVGIPALLEDGIKLLVYAGEYDLICNWLGNSRWVHAMEWRGQKAFVASPEVPFEVDGAKAGLLTSHGPLSFLKVHDAGHMVPMDQPKASLEMLKRWMEGLLSKSTTDSGTLVSSI